MSASIVCAAAPVVCAAPAMRPASRQVAAKKVFVSNNTVAKTSAMQVRLRRATDCANNAYLRECVTNNILQRNFAHAAPPRP